MTKAVGKLCTLVGWSVMLGVLTGSSCPSGDMSGVPNGDPLPDDSNGNDNPPFTIPLVDSDGDGLADADELRIGSDPLNSDTDGDGLSDYEEIVEYLTSATNVDSDFDQIDDYEEVFTYNTDPNSPDTDEDGLFDGLEIDEFFGSDPLDPDTDGDGFLDGEEIDFGLDLLLPNSSGVVVDSLCRDYIEVLVEGLDGVFKSPLGNHTLHGFQPGDLVALREQVIIDGEPIGPVLSNLTTGESGFFAWYGERGLLLGHITDAYFVGSSSNLTIEVNGIFMYEVSSNFANLSLWSIGDPVSTSGPNVPSDPFSAPHLINLRTCDDTIIFR